MKKTILSLTLLSLLLCITACSDESTDDAGQSIQRQEQTITYSEGTNVYEINNDIGTLTLRGFPVNSTVYLSKTNPTETIVSMENTHYITESVDIKLNRESIQSRSAISGASPVPGAKESHHSCQSMHLAEITRKQCERIMLQADASRAAAGTVQLTDKTIDQNGNEKKFKLGDTKHFFLDAETTDAEKLLWWSEGEGSLEGIGKNAAGEPVCYVWVVGEVTAYNFDRSVKFTEETTLTTEASAKKGKVNRRMAQDYADAFVKIYDLDTTVFGDIPRKAYCKGDRKTLDDMKYLSETGTVINLIFYDIDHKKENAGLCGFYWGDRDLSPNADHYRELTGNSYNDSDVLRFSNEGNYMYINSYMSDKTGSMYTTIVHEFQHMIQQQMKGFAIEPFEYPDTTFNEMLSVASEDLVFMFFPEITYNTETAILSYMPDGQAKYVYNGIEYNPKMEYLYYGTGFSFAAWLMRKYSVGAISAISRNQYRGIEAVLEGIKTIDDNLDITTESLLKEYSTACILGTDQSKENTAVIFNALASGIAEDNTEGYKYYCESQNYGYPLIQINIDGKNNESTTTFASNSEEYKRKFPDEATKNEFGELILHGFKKYASNQIADLRPYGMMLHDIGKVLSSDSARLTFSSDKSPSPSEKLYLLIMKE